jgi:hypothetical protein
MRSIRLQIATVCEAYASNLLPEAQCALKLLTHAQHMLAKNKILHDFATTSAVCASNLLPYAQYALAKCYRMRSVR